MSKISAYTALTSPASSDVLPVVDVSDTSMAASGTTKKATIATLLTAGTGAAVNVLNTAYAGGADPTGAAACDAAFTAAVTAALASGQPVIIPPGTYSTAATLNWKASGLVVRAPGGPDNTTISCTGSNIPIAQFAGNYQDISGLTFSYATAQTSGQTAANCITFGDDTIGNCYAGNYHELTLLKGQTGMAINPAITTSAGLFSCRLANIVIGTCSSSFIIFNGNNNNGLANCSGCVFENIYCSYTGGTLAGVPVSMRNWDEFVFNQLNIEHCTVTSQDVLQLGFVNNAVFNSLHLEALTTSLNGGSLLRLVSTGAAVINGMSARFNIYTGSASNPLVNFVGTGPSTLIVNGLNEATCTVTTPSHPLINFGTATNCIAQIIGQAGSQATVTSVNAGAGDVVQKGAGLAFAGGAMTGNLGLAAGTSSLAPLTFQSGTSLTAAGAGNAEFDGTAFYLTAAASARQVAVAEQIQVLSGSYTLANNTSAQALLNATASGALTVQGSTTYEFECLFYISGLSSSSHQVSFGVGGTASFTSFLATSLATPGASAGTTGMSVFTSASAVAVISATANTTCMALIRGVMRINAGGTITPQVTQVTASAAAVVAANSFFRCWPIGSGSVTSVGNWS